MPDAYIDAYIYDAVRTPRGRGKPDGALYEVTALKLAETTLRALKDRNDLDATLVDDVVSHVVRATGEATAVRVLLDRLERWQAFLKKPFRLEQLLDAVARVSGASGKA